MHTCPSLECRSREEVQRATAYKRRTMLEVVNTRFLSHYQVFIFISSLYKSFYCFPLTIKRLSSFWTNDFITNKQILNVKCSGQS